MFFVKYSSVSEKLYNTPEAESIFLPRKYTIPLLCSVDDSSHSSPDGKRRMTFFCSHNGSRKTQKLMFFLLIHMHWQLPYQKRENYTQWTTKNYATMTQKEQKALKPAIDQLIPRVFLTTHSYFFLRWSDWSKRACIVCRSYLVLWKIVLTSLKIRGQIFDYCQATM